jgi:UDP-N-acetylglucosamine 2-epimerase (non-hydrolysing)
VHGKIFVVGNTVIDSLLYGRNKILRRKKEFNSRYGKFLMGFDRMILITGHRRESFGSGFEQICAAIKELAARYPSVSFVYPVHLNPMVQQPVYKFLNGLPNVFLIEPVPYDEMIFLMMESFLILTDSGGVQEEAPSLGKPVIVMRNKTERMEGVRLGCSVLAGNLKRNIVGHTVRILSNPALYKKMSRVKNPYGSGDSARLISEIIKKEFKK